MHDQHTRFALVSFNITRATVPSNPGFDIACIAWWADGTVDREKPNADYDNIGANSGLQRLQSDGSKTMWSDI